MVTPTRIRRRRAATAPADTGTLDKLLKSISDADKQLAKHAASRKLLVEQVEAEMRRLHLTERHTEWADAIFERSAGRAVNTIDPRGFRKLVKDDKEFFSAIKVLSEEAKKVLSGKELESITEKTPGKAGPETLKIVTR